jgi:predicted O-methyltransferase YrrM
VNAILADLLATGRITRADGTTIPLHSSTSREEGEALQRLIRAYRPQVTLEVGLAYGISALFICEALAEVGGRSHITVDPMQQAWENIGLRHLEQAGFSGLIEHHEAPSHCVLPALGTAGRRIDFAFIDGWHTFDYAMVDFFYIDRLLRPGGVLVLDDAWSYRAIRKLARYIVTHRRYRPIDTGISAKVRPSLIRSLLAPLRAPTLKPRLAHLIQPAILTPDAALGLPAHDLVAFVKVGDDLLGDGSAGSRRWDQHVEF